MIGRPEHLAGRRRQGRHRILAAHVPRSGLLARRFATGEEDHIAVNDEGRRKERLNDIGAGDRIGLPELVARGFVERR